MNIHTALHADDCEPFESLVSKIGTWYKMPRMPPKRETNRAGDFLDYFVADESTLVEGWKNVLSGAACIPSYYWMHH
jgi:hypothetical protein